MPGATPVTPVDKSGAVIGTQGATVASPEFNRNIGAPTVATNQAAEVANGVTDVVNVQVIDTPTNTSCKLLANRTNRSTVSLIGLTVLSLPAQPGVTWVHAVALEP